MAADDDEKTEEPTQRKLDQAREKGDIVYSPEVGTALSLIVVTGIVAFMAGPIASQMAHAFIGFLATPDQFSPSPARSNTFSVRSASSCSRSSACCAWRSPAPASPRATSKTSRPSPATSFSRRLKS